MNVSVVRLFIRVRFADVTHVLFGVIIPTEGTRCDDDDKAIKIYQIISLTFFGFSICKSVDFLGFLPFFILSSC